MRIVYIERLKTSTAHRFFQHYDILNVVIHGVTIVGQNVALQFVLASLPN